MRDSMPRDTGVPSCARECQHQVHASLPLHAMLPKLEGQTDAAAVASLLISSRMSCLTGLAAASLLSRLATLRAPPLLLPSSTHPHCDPPADTHA